MHRQSIGGLQWELQHDGFRGELEIFLPDGAVYHIYVRKERASLLQRSLLYEASTEARMRGRHCFLRTLHGSIGRTPMQETALRAVGKALVHREIAGEHATHHMLPVQQRFGLEVRVVISGQMQKPAALRFGLRPNERNPLVGVPVLATGAFAVSTFEFGSIRDRLLFYRLPSTYV